MVGYVKSTKSVDLNLLQNDYSPDIDSYREHAKSQKAKAKGVERLAYEIFGSDIIGSVAFAIDPYKKFRYKQHRVAPVSRIRFFPCIRFQQRTGFRHQVNTTHVTTIGKGPLYSPLSGNATYEFVADNSSGISIDDQESIDGFIRDTTAKTRLSGFTQGEFELYFPKIECFSAAYSRVQNRHDTVSNVPDLYNQSVYSEKLDYGFIGPCARLSKEDHDIFLDGYRTDVEALFAKNAIFLVGSCLPSRRRYSLLYNVAELRDLPLLIRHSVSFFKDIFGHVRDIKSLGDLYLAYKFGWESTVKDVLRLLSLPERISRDVNRLISRSGKPTTFRSRMSVGGPLATLPGFTTETFNIFDESGDSHSSNEGSHSGEIRVAINAILKLPYVDIPSAQRLNLILRQLGADPSPVDIFNLVPWTWLADWFTGVGDYLQAIEAISYDQSLINYGLITFKSRGKSTFTFNGISAQNTDSSSYSPPIPPVYKENISRFTAERSAEFSFKYQRRKDVMPYLVDVKNSSDETRLSPYQLSIITALAAKYGDKGSKSAARLSNRVVK